MTDPLVVFAVCVVVTALGAVAAPFVARAVGQLGWIREIAARARVAVRSALPALTTPGVAFIVGVLGLALVVGVCWPLGWLSRAVEPTVDVPVFDWAAARAIDGWVSVNEVLTDMGANSVVQKVVLIAAIPLSVLWRKSGWWIPVPVVVLAYGAQRVGQITLERVIGRNTPPGSSGDFPSGGVSRILVVYGTIVLLVCIGAGLSRRWRWALLSLVVLAAVVEAYTRVYLLKHWVSDAVAGLVYGGLLLGVSVAVLWVVVHARRPSSPKRSDRVKVLTTTAGLPMTTTPS